MCVFVWNMYLLFLIVKPIKAGDIGDYNAYVVSERSRRIYAFHIQFMRFTFSLCVVIKFTFGKWLETFIRVLLALSQPHKSKLMELVAVCGGLYARLNDSKNTQHADTDEWEREIWLDKSGGQRLGTESKWCYICVHKYIEWDAEYVQRTHLKHLSRKLKAKLFRLYFSLRAGFFSSLFSAFLSHFTLNRKKRFQRAISFFCTFIFLYFFNIILHWIQIRNK